MKNKENSILFSGLIRRLNFEEATETRTFLEDFAEKFVEAVNSDDERRDRVGREMVEALASSDLNRFVVAVCGWEPASLLEFYMDSEEQKKIINKEKRYKRVSGGGHLIDLVAIYEYVYDINEDERTTTWFGDYNMWVIKNNKDAEFAKIIPVALESFCTNESEYDQMPDSAKTSTALEKRFRKFKNVLPKYRFSLVQYEEEKDGIIDGVWIQDCTGTFEEACKRAKETEDANSNRIKVAVVATSASTVPSYDLQKGLVKLN